MTPGVAIRCCTQCRWLLRAGWLAQERLTTSESGPGGVALVPGTGGIFEATALKQRIRDRIAPDKPLGHGDRQ